MLRWPTQRVVLHTLRHSGRIGGRPRRRRSRSGGGGGGGVRPPLRDEDPLVVAVLPRNGDRGDRLLLLRLLPPPPPLRNGERERLDRCGGGFRDPRDDRLFRGDGDRDLRLPSPPRSLGRCCCC